MADIEQTEQEPRTSEAEAAPRPEARGAQRQRVPRASRKATVRPRDHDAKAEVKVSQAGVHQEAAKVAEDLAEIVAIVRKAVAARQARARRSR